MRTPAVVADAVELTVVEERDDLDDFIDDESAKDPEFAAAFADAERRAELFLTLVARRRAVGLSQAQVAKRMGTTQSAVSDLERTTPDVLLSTLQRYGRAVGASIVVSVTFDADSGPSTDVANAST